MTTPVLLVAGINLDDPGALDPGALDNVFRTSCEWSAPGHPDHSCGASYCPIDELNETTGVTPYR